jgi:hypothetical protein
MDEIDNILTQFRERVKITPCPEFAVRFDTRLVAGMNAAVVSTNAMNVHVAMSSEAFQSLIGCRDWYLTFEPRHRHDDILRGSVGISLGMEFWTDTYLHPDQQFMPSCMIYVAAFDNDGKMHKVLGTKVY